MPKKTRSETAKTLKNSAGRAETPKHGQDLRSRIRTGNLIIINVRIGTDVKF